MRTNGWHPEYKNDLIHEFFDYQNQSILYDKRLMMETETGEGLNPIEKFIDTIYPQLNLNKSDTHIILQKTALNNLIANILVAAKESKYLALKRGSGAYSNSSFYGLKYYTHANIVKIVDKLEKLGYVECKKGNYDRIKGKGVVSRLNATGKLLDTITLHTYIPLSYGENEDEPCKVHYLYGKKLKRIRFSKPVLLKDENKNLLRYNSKDHILRKQKFLNQYNTFINQHKITIPTEIYDNNQRRQTASISNNKTNLTSNRPPILVRFDDKSFGYKGLDCWLYRVFNNGKFTHGGRFYGAEYQGYTELERAEILIDDMETCEVDYGACHVRMLYHLDKLDCKSDPYTMVSANPELRLLIKKMLQMIINAKSRGEAIGAFYKWLRDQPTLYQILNESGLSGKDLARMVMQTHKRLEKHFITGIGVKLQYRDSKIAERILKHFTRKKIVCLCIHDSFIVPRQYQDELIEVMKREYKREIGFDCELKVNE